MEECCEKARAHYPAIRQYGLIEKTEAYSLANASRAWLPQLAFSAQATVQSDVVHWPDSFEKMLAAQGLQMPGLQKDQYKIQLDLQQSLWDGGKSRSDRSLAASVGVLSPDEEWTLSSTKSRAGWRISTSAY